jgi:hypothetical protein
MESEDWAGLKALTDAELESRVRGLAAAERTATADLLAHLAEMETRDVHLRAGYASLYIYCRDALRLSEGCAKTFVEVARAARRFPIILDLLVEGAVNTTTVRLLAPHLTPENHRGVLESARGKRKLQVEEIAARLSPVPDVPDLVCRLSATATLLGPGGRGTPQATRSPAVVPVAPSRYRVQLTLGEHVFEKLRLARDMLRHAVPSGDEAEVVDRALTALLAELARKRFAATPGPRASAGTAEGSRHVPADVKRAVWLRDLGRCAFVGESGLRCGERGFVEFHHVTPFAVGGPATAGNIQLRCRRHNTYEARAYFGPLGRAPVAAAVAGPDGPSRTG